MNIDAIKQDQQYSHRTQISISKSMYRQLMKEKGELGLAEYVRKIILQTWQRQVAEQQKRQEVLELLEKPMKKSSLSVEEVLAQEREVRADRTLNKVRGGGK